MRNKFCEIHDILSEDLCDMFFLSETKIDSSFPDSQFSVQNFRMHRQDRNEHGGGLVCYIKSSISHRRRDDFELNVNGIECIVIEVLFDKTKMFVICIYRPPSVHVSHLIEAIDKMFTKCLVEGQFIILIGDFNVDFNNVDHSLTDTMEIFSLKNIIDGATCRKNTNNPTSIDVILTNQPKRLAGSLNTNIDLSDFHNIIGTASKVHVDHMVKRTIIYRSYKNYNAESFNESLLQAPFQLCEIFFGRG